MVDGYQPPPSRALFLGRFSKWRINPFCPFLVERRFTFLICMFAGRLRTRPFSVISPGLTSDLCPRSDPFSALHFNEQESSLKALSPLRQAAPRMDTAIAAARSQHPFLKGSHSCPASSAISSQLLESVHYGDCRVVVNPFQDSRNSL